MISSFGESGFSVFQAGHCDWQRPHSVQVVEVEQALPGEVLDRADPELGVLVEVLDVVEGDRLARGGQRLHRTEGVRLAAEEDVQRSDEDVQVLGVQHEDQEDQHHADVQQQAEPSRNSRLSCGIPSRRLPTPIEMNAPLS